MWLVVEIYCDNYWFLIEEVIKEVGVGEVVILMLMKKGVSGVVEWILIWLLFLKFGFLDKVMCKVLIVGFDLVVKY